MILYLVKMIMNNLPGIILELFCIELWLYYKESLSDRKLFPGRQLEIWLLICMTSELFYLLPISGVSCRFSCRFASGSNP